MYCMMAPYPITCSAPALSSVSSFSSKLAAAWCTSTLLILLIHCLLSSSQKPTIFLKRTSNLSRSLKYKGAEAEFESQTIWSKDYCIHNTLHPQRRKSETQYEKSLFKCLIPHWPLSNVSKGLIHVHFCSPCTCHIEIHNKDMLKDGWNLLINTHLSSLSWT